MKILNKKNLICLFVLIICLFAFSIVGCSDDNNTEQPTEEQTVESLLISQSNVSLQVYEDGRLSVLNEQGTASWSSLNSDVVEVDESGYFLAKKEGTTYITAKVGDKTGKCKIVVQNDNLRPIVRLGVSVDSLTLLKDDEFEINPYVLYNGKEYYDAHFNFGNLNDVVEVSGNTVKALNKGNTVVDVSASWHGYNGLLAIDLPVNVIENNYIEINGRVINLETSSYLGKPTSYDLTAKLFVDGEEVQKQINWEFVGGDGECIEFTNGTLSSVKEGQTSLIAKATLDSGEAVYSPTVIVNVVQTVVNVDGVQSIDYDVATLDFGLPGNYTVEKLYDGEAQLAFDIGGLFTPYKMGERVIKACVKDENGKDVIFNYNAKIVKKISTAEELVSISSSYGNAPSAENNYTYYGYFELANNIDAKGYVMQNYVNADYNVANPIGGFIGVFDGKGYTIDNLSAYCDDGFAFGVFGQIGYGSVVKNVAFTNLHGTFSSNINFECASLAYYSFGSVENVFIHTNDEFISSVRFGGKGARFSNFVVFAPNYYTVYIDIYDCLVGSAVCYSDLVGQNTVIDGDSVITVSKEEYTSREWKAFNINTFKTQILSYDPSEYFLDAIWTAEKGKMPFFNSMFKTDVEVFVGESYDLTEIDKDGSFSLAEDYDGVSIDGGKLNISNGFSGDKIVVNVVNELFACEHKVNFNLVGTYLNEIIYDLNGSEGINATIDGIDGIDSLYINDVMIQKADYGFTSNVLTVPRNVIDNLGLSYGEHRIKIVSSGKNYVGKFTVVTKVIYTAEDLINLQVKYGNDANESNGYSYDGYFILNNNINAQGYTWNSIVKLDEQNPSKCGFKGIFDGRGYTIKNLQVLTDVICYGVFGGLAEGAVVKNVAFVGIGGNPSNNINHNMAILAYYNSGLTENVYVETENAFTSTFRYEGNATYKNFVVIAPALYTPYIEYYDCKVGCALAYSALPSTKPEIDFNTVITVSDDEYYSNPAHRLWLAFNTKTYLTDIADYKAEEYFDSEIWDVRNGKIPCFKSSDKTEQGVEWDERWSNK